MLKGKCFKPIVVINVTFPCLLLNVTTRKFKIAGMNCLMWVMCSGNRVRQFYHCVNLTRYFYTDDDKI